MQNDDIERRILRYLSDGFDDRDYMAEIVAVLPLAETCAVIYKLLRSPDDRAVGVTALFVRDVMSRCAGNPQCQEFQAAYPDSAIIKTLEKLIFSDRHHIRQAAIYTLGKTGSHSSKTALIRAFDLYGDSDPLLLDRLIFELNWLGVENIDRYIHSMATSSSDLTRWAAVACTISIGDFATSECVKILRQDRCDLIRIQAEYEYQQAMQPQALTQLAPLLSFDRVSIRFGNYLATNNLKNYPVQALEQFVERLQAELSAR